MKATLYKSIKKQEGFTLSVALIMTTIMLAVSFSVSTIISKSVKISGLATEGAAAYFAAESGVDCVTGLEDAALSIERRSKIQEVGFFRSTSKIVTYIDSNGDQQAYILGDGDTTNIRSSPSITGFSCGGGLLGLISGYPTAVNIDAKTYRMTKVRMNATAGVCAEVEVYKASEGGIIIVSRGYSKCGGDGAIARELRVTID